MSSPYEGLEPRAFWKTGVAERMPLEPGDIYRPRFRVNRQMKVMTAGSCFAQHVGRALRGAGLTVIDTEPLPDWVPDEVAQSYGYRLFSARYGNIYTARQFDQLLAEAHGEIAPALPIWDKGAAFVDSQRPGLEPEGLPSAEDVVAHREGHLAAVREAAKQADLLVFTLGLTETWEHCESGTVYPTAPGTIAGSFSPEVFRFRNFHVGEVVKDLGAVRRRLMALNPDVRMLLTVSPVPLTATASGQHVEVATAYSKATLRAAAGLMVEKFGNVDYMPSYEIITSQGARGAFYAPNLRSVTPRGVATAMEVFLSAHGLTAPRKGARTDGPPADDPVCEEALLEAFAQ